MGEKIIGKRVNRIEDIPLLTGIAKFLDDIQLPDTLYAAFVRSPLAHATIKSINSDEAEATVGVKAVYTLADLLPSLTDERLPLGFPPGDLPENITPFVLAKNEVAYVGEAVAVVIAECRSIAEDGVSAITVEYDSLPVVADCNEALNSDTPPARRGRESNVLIEFEQNYGDCDAAFASAPHVFAETITQHRGCACPLEGRGVLANFSAAEGILTVWSSTQMAHEIRSFLVQMLGCDETQLRVVTPVVGGGFGGKFTLYPEEVVIATAAKILGQPVKWIEDRHEQFLSMAQERDQIWNVEVAVDDDARLLGVTGTLIHDQGAYTLQGINLPYNASTAVPGPYQLPNYRLNVMVVETNKVPTLPVRGAGYPEGTFVMERLLDRVARELAMDRAEVRRRNLVQAKMMPYRTLLKTRSGTNVTYDSGDFPKCLELTLSNADYSSFRVRQSEARHKGRHLGIGIGIGMKGTGRGPFESATVRIGRSGRVSVYTGAAAMGQGIETGLAQICAEQFDLPTGEVRVVCGDTATIAMGLGGFASRQAVTAGSSTHLAASAVRSKVLEIGSILLDEDIDNLDLKDGYVRVLNDSNRVVSLQEVARVATGVPGGEFPPNIEPGLEATVNFQPKNLAYDIGAHVVEVEVDVDTGLVTIQRYVALTDCGIMINPMIVEGQIHGGITHGIGNALFERMVFDEQAQPITATFVDYALPRCQNVPTFEIAHMETPSPLNPLGVKGVGEAGTVPAIAAIISAVEDALGTFGIQIAEYPLFPARIFELIQASRKTSGTD
jgi:carbon-monoxide dehydrogenase large subunit